MMRNSEIIAKETRLHSKAVRAAEWWRIIIGYAEYDRMVGWVVKDENNNKISPERTINNSRMISLAEDRGWLDAEWVTTITDQTTLPTSQPEKIGELYISVISGPWTNGKWEWKVSEEGIIIRDSGESNTRAEARARAITAAKNVQ